MRLLTQAIFIGALASGCSKPLCPVNAANQKPTYGSHELLASIRRTGCFGWCPIYQLTVFRDGQVEYRGEHFVKTIGRATGQVTREVLSQLDDLFARLAYVALDDAYDDFDMTDLPTTYTSYRPPGCRTKSVEHYHGDRDAPKSLVEVENGIDQIVNVEQWIGTKEERQKLRGY